MMNCTDPIPEALLNLYVDGEAASGDQARLFAHLSICEACRRQFNALLAFRLAVRQEAFDVPPAVDEAIFARIDKIRRAPRPAPDRVFARRFFGGQVHRRVSFRSGLLAAVVIVAFGLAVRFGAIPEPRQAYHVTETVIDDGALYVINPGVTVEEEKVDR